MKHKPNSDLIPPGTYTGVVSTADEKVSKAGNEMIELFVDVWDAAGEQFSIQDFLVAMTSMEWKTRHFCKSAGLEYEKGDLPASSLVGLAVTVKLDTVDNGKYGTQSKIVDYLVADGASKPATPPSKPNPADDDIPF